MKTELRILGTALLLLSFASCYRAATLIEYTAHLGADTHQACIFIKAAAPRWQREQMESYKACQHLESQLDSIGIEAAKNELWFAGIGMALLSFAAAVLLATKKRRPAP